MEAHMETMDIPRPATEATVPVRDTTSFPRGSSGELHTQELGITYQKLGKTQWHPHRQTGTQEWLPLHQEILKGERKDTAPILHLGGWKAIRRAIHFHYLAKLNPCQTTCSISS